MERKRARILDLPRPVWLLGWVSLATDSASEAIYPLLPFFLTQVLGAGAVSLGIIEGAAEAANSALKVLSGRIADRSRTKRPLVLIGYSVSSAVRPLIALTTTWAQVFSVRVCDRIGKGVRGAPRDAMLATWATAGTRGKVYGFHRAMDHLGAVVGPILASLFLLLYPGQYRTLFALTIVPGAIAVLLILLIREGADGPREAISRDAANSPARLVADDTRSPVPSARVVAGEGPVPSARVAGGEGPVPSARVAGGEGPVPSARVAGGEGPVPSARVAGGEGLPRQFHLFMGVLGVFTLGNSTDAFLLLRLTDVAGSVSYVPLMWAGLHVVKSVVSIAGGSWSDRIGRRTVIAVGWLIYAAVYVGFALATTLPVLLGWFMLYGLYFGFTEGTEKALVADLAPASRRGTAFGIFTAVQGLGGLAASVLFGVVWKAYGVAPAFATGAALALVATGLLFVVIGPTTVEEPCA